MLTRPLSWTRPTVATCVAGGNEPLTAKLHRDIHNASNSAFTKAPPDTSGAVERRSSFLHWPLKWPAAKVAAPPAAAQLSTFTNSLSLIVSIRNMKEKLILSAVFAFALSLAACVQESKEQPEEEPGAQGEAPKESGTELGDRFTGTVGDFTVRVTNLADPSTIVEVEMPDFEGRKQVSVTADVTNNGTHEIDLACGLELDANILANGSSWGNVGYLERVPGNPACGEMLKPGETKQMTWVSLMPADQQPTNLSIEDTAHPDDYLQLKVR